MRALVITFNFGDVPTDHAKVHRTHRDGSRKRARHSTHTHTHTANATATSAIPEPCVQVHGRREPSESAPNYEFQHCDLLGGVSFLCFVCVCVRAHKVADINGNRACTGSPTKAEAAMCIDECDSQRILFKAIGSSERASERAKNNSIS